MNNDKEYVLEKAVLRFLSMQCAFPTAIVVISHQLIVEHKILIYLFERERLKENALIVFLNCCESCEK